MKKVPSFLKTPNLPGPDCFAFLEEENEEEFFIFY